MLCYSCGKQKNELQPCKSDIIDGVNLFMCQTCIESKFEPRWVIILAGRQFGAESVKDYINKRRYLGKPILAEELIA
jgi:NMD protein affecting ribosome stability and mRNA decay